MRYSFLTVTFAITVVLGRSTGVEAQLVQRFAEDHTGAGEVAVGLARQALELSCRQRERLAVPADLPPLLHRPGAVFVSTMQPDGAPRCCMGTLYPRSASLADDIIEAAWLAAAHDFRFPPLKPSELSRLRVIVSFLDPPQPVDDPYHLDPITDGLVVRSGQRTGVVLPGETAHLANFVAWGRIRAAATTGERVQYLQLNAIRYIEPPHGSSGSCSTLSVRSHGRSS